MTSDGLAGTAITYNHLDLPRKISVAGGTTKANYCYLADGTKVSALSSGGTGLVYRGPFTYRRASDGSLTLESAACAEGRLTPGGAMLHLTDHLGSVVAVVRGSDGALYGASEYDAYGKRSSLTSAGTVPVPEGVTLRDGFTGKDDQSPDFGLAYADFGARQYSPALRRWLVPDPLSEKYYGISPYAYCSGDPVNRVDPDGKTTWKINQEGELVSEESDDTQDCFQIVDPDGNVLFSQSFNPNIFTSNSEKGSKFSFSTSLTDAGINAFQFLSENLNVEVGGIVAYDNGNVLSTSIFTDGIHNRINMLDRINSMIADDKEPTYIMHSHPDNTIPSGFAVKQKENGDMNCLLKMGEKCNSDFSAFVYRVTSQDYLRYDNVSNNRFSRYVWRDNHFIPMINGRSRLYIEFIPK